ncbi:hypothetical protein F901_00722 [Acinetobacter dispersus]|uniref:hypothetical protein n=1 Tax=Acinetobacter dispersus TaxID=70348 RepID=UPI0002CD9E75|nr:hypothetical protein [Acinetobacter dispersus]ENX53463.1 hypothetical protein F901_00722 [Acinetobacter dispersus]
MKELKTKKVYQNDARLGVQHNNWLNQTKVGVVTAVITSLICASIPTYAADLEIYKVPEDSVGATTLMMMLDLSGSMGWGDGYTTWDSRLGKYVPYTSMSIQEDYEVCSGTNTGVRSDTNTTSYYTRYYCTVPANTTNQKVTGYWSPSTTDANRKWVTGCEKQSDNSYRCYDRLTRLKDGLRQVLEGTPTVPRIDDKIILGLSTFAGNNGYIRIPARALNAATGTTKQVLVTKTRIVYDTVPIYETRQEEFVITPAVPAYNRLYWRRVTTTSSGTTYRYSTCSWNATTKVCTSWSNLTSTVPKNPNFDSSKLSTSCSISGYYNCREFYDAIPAVPAVTGTRPIQVQIGTEQVPRTETYTEWETQNVLQRELLLKSLKDFNASGGTPTPYAYAEAAAYLLGTNTNVANYSATYFQVLGNQLQAGANRQPWVCKTPLEASNTYNHYKDGSRGKAVTIRWCSDAELKDSRGRWLTWNIDPSWTKLAYSSDRELYYEATKPLTLTINGSSYSGWASSSADSKTQPAASATNYESPTSITSQANNANKKECSGQGVYFLTDGQPEPNGWPLTTDDGKSGTAYNMMQQALGTKGSSFSCAASPLGKLSGYSNVNNGWACIGKFAQALLDPTQNPTGLKIQTAVVGFGSSFGEGATQSDDIKDAKDWGVVGDGGWIAGSSPEDVSKSINDFINKLNKDVPSMSTGSSTIPMDALNPSIIQSYAYFPQFEPKVNPADQQQLWFGNLKKYYVVNNGVYASTSGGAANTVVLKSQLQDLADIWAKSGITYPENTPIYKKGGALSQLLLGTVTTTDDNGESSTAAGRKLLTDYTFDGTKDEANRVSRNFDLNRIDYNYTTNDATETDVASRVRGLMALLGYNISSETETNSLDLTTATANLRQMGSVYHSLPILLTQEGKAVAETNATTNKVQISTVGRKDYVMFGTTQGLLSVVDASSGVEKFSFVPKEMIEKQSETFKANAGSLAGGKNALYYGMDGEWTAHTVYVTKSDGTLTVKGTVRNVIGSTKEEKENLSGKQWVYGGMRMGGRSYYSLDLTDIENPKLKFHIDPSTGKVYSPDYPEGKTFSPITNMGQSWSKPKLDYVNWKGKRKLVMFVGGGYDAGGTGGDGTWANGIRTGYAGYEHYNYNQDNKRGAGVYMFDADKGDLLWYADANAEPDTEPTSGTGTSTTEAIPHLVNNDLKYSVASEIKTVDRNNDGMVDHIYFGDLAGQAFRVDFARSKEKFNTQGTKILNLHQTDGTSPRFYLPPVFTAHHSAGKKEGANVVVVSFISGNKSSPLLATSDSPTTTGKTDPLGLQFDAVYAIYDYEIHPDGTFYPTSHVAARTLAATDAGTASTSQLKYISNNEVARNDTATTLVKGADANSESGWGGWYYRFEKKFSSTGLSRVDAGPSIIKGLAPLIAMEGNLYVTMYDASNNGTSSSCGAGVKGHSFTQRICLPTGVCAEDANYMYNLGAGINSLNVGSVSGGETKSIVVQDPEDVGVGCVGTACKTGQKFITAGGSMRFIPNRWYERYAKVD